MWNSPDESCESGKRYNIADLTALILPLEELVDQIMMLPGNIRQVRENILVRLDSEEFILVLYQVFQALLEDRPVPKDGHTGIQEAMVAELLNKAFEKVCSEIEMGDTGYYCRKVVWNSIDRLLIQGDRFGPPRLPFILESTDLQISDPNPYQSPAITLEHWDELISGESGLFAEFFWDDDWRMEAYMDTHPDKARRLTEMLGLDLDVVQSLPHTPSKQELTTAKSYLKHLTVELELLFPFENESREDEFPF